MIKQDENYIRSKKNRYLKMGLVWIGIVLAIFLAGVIVTKQRATYFTVVAAVLVIPLSQNLTRYVAFRKFNPPDKEHASILNRIKGDYYLYHGVLVPDAKTIHFFDHVMVTEKYIYFIAEDKETIDKVKNWIIETLSAKGITQKELKFINIKDEQNIKVVAKNIEKEIQPKATMIDEKSEILEAMMM